MSNKLIVLKIGTNTLFDNAEINFDMLNTLASSIKKYRKQNINFVIVTSGAVQSGANELNLSERPKNLKELQVASAVGQVSLIHTYKEIFNKHDIAIAQILISKNVLEDRNQFINTTEALNGLISKNILPIINENDVVATEELKFGDNDRLSAIVSIIVNAAKLIIITNKEGLYNFNPDKNKDAKKIEFDLMELFEEKDWVKLTHMMIDHGRAVCIARRPQCNKCIISRFCPSFIPTN